MVTKPTTAQKCMNESYIPW